jgi:hypothetical protein
MSITINYMLTRNIANNGHENIWAVCYCTGVHISAYVVMNAYGKVRSYDKIYPNVSLSITNSTQMTMYC